MTSSAKTLWTSLGLLRARRFGTFWFASLLSNIGTWAQQVAEPWLLLSLGASSFLIGLDSFAMNAPVWLLTLVGGVLADRADRRRVITLFQSVQMLCPTLIALLLLKGSIRPVSIIALSVFVGVTDALSMPSFQSIVPSIVERAQIGRGLALNSTQFNLSRILGPAIAGVLLGSVGAVACFALSAASYVPFIGVALWILPRSAARPARDDAFDRRHPLAGLREIEATPHLRGALLTVVTTSVLCGPLVTFSPVLVSAGFHGNAARFSTVAGAFGVGGPLGATGLLAVPLDTVSFYMLAMRGGISVGGLLTGLSVGLLGVRHALLINGALAVVTHLAIGRLWLRSPLPKPAGRRCQGTGSEKETQ